MYSKTTAWDQVTDRGPRWAVMGTIRPHEAITEYADTADRAETIREQFADIGYHQIQVYPPAGSVNLAELGRRRTDARRAYDEAREILRAGVIRAIEDGRSEAEVARSAGVTRDTVRTWVGK